jgi:hypothetical protein
MPDVVKDAGSRDGRRYLQGNETVTGQLSMVIFRMKVRALRGGKRTCHELNSKGSAALSLRDKAVEDVMVIS